MEHATAAPVVEMSMKAHENVSSVATAASSSVSVSTPLLKRGVLVGLGSGADIIVNYPLWITAKRLGAGLGWPSLREIYKGGGLLWASQFPTVAAEDLGSRALVPFVQQVCGTSLSSDAEHAIAAGAAGALAGVAVASPTENVVTRAHKTGQSTSLAALEVMRGGLKGTLLPRGVAAMVGREIPFSLGLFFLKDRASHLCHKFDCSADASTPKRIVSWTLADLAASFGTAAFCGIVAQPASVVLALQQADDIPLSKALTQIGKEGITRGFYKGYVPRTISIAGSLFVYPLVFDNAAAFGLA
eukprot:gnl/MRDRNA2_/MRDRNA2_181332_c0_seq1.p1 gnl/MRDRNA2_/MRDRNA2_181332_c0~~gnl/MRDRNA2_/MRDRNA2_181332_c0_seq1.p1  ORF type:complete len:318 (-),score=44.02 gnl/MRDRNA2_/MRDRNA2_181332_c0_seq1:30-932(-)